MSNPPQAPMPLLTPYSAPYSGDMAAFMMAETRVAKDANLDVPHRLDIPSTGFTSARVGQFLNEPINMSVSGLEGCTVMGVISEKGAWLAHVWEVPSMREGGYFERDVIKVIQVGDPSPDPLTGLQWVPSLSSMVGPGNLFHDQFRPRIFTLTPGDPNEPQTAIRRYPWQVSRIDFELHQIIPSAPSINTGYSLFQLSRENPVTAKGKLLLQYTPAQKLSPGSPQEAMVRIYVTDNPEDVIEFTWHAHQEQKL